VPRTLITGLSGQDGTYLSRLLLDRGYEVHGVVKPGDPLETSEVQLHPADLRDAQALAAIVESVRPDELYNLGGLTSVARSWDDPLETVEVTGASVAALLEAAWRQQQSGTPVAFVQASSAEIFGIAEQVPQNESTPISPVSPYGAAKALGHFLVRAFRERGMAASSAILYNHESPLRPETFVTRKITSSAARISRGQQQKLTLGNLDAQRDWGWAPDYVEALSLMARYPGGGDFVIGTGQSHTVREFVAAAFAAVGIADWQSYVDVDPSFTRAVDPHRQVADSSKARAKLGWEPTIGFDELVARMVKADLEALPA
jgi:GDPmannose 4,6-dehydratase